MKAGILVNGCAEGLIKPMDRGFHYGDGLFETILVESGRVIFLQEHLGRLQRGCNVLGLPEVDETTIKQEIEQLISVDCYGVIKIILTRGVGERGFLPPSKPNITRVVRYSPVNKSIDQPLEQIGLVLCKTQLSKQPLLAGIKHLNQLERVLARAELKEHPLVEGLMCDTSNAVIEGIMSNIFIAKDGVLKTPKLNNCGVIGVIRQLLFHQAKKDNIELIEVGLTLNDIQTADEIFITNSLMPVRAIAQLTINDMQFDKAIGRYACWALDSVKVLIKKQVSELGCCK